MIFSLPWMFLREGRYNVATIHSATAGGMQQALPCHTVTVPPTGSHSYDTVGEHYPWHFIQQQTAKGRAFVHRAMGHSENGFPSGYEKDFLPSVWQSMQSSCILSFRVAVDSKQLYMIVGCECLPLRWKIFSFPCEAFVGSKYSIQWLIQACGTCGFQLNILNRHFLWYLPDTVNYFWQFAVYSCDKF